MRAALAVLAMIFIAPPAVEAETPFVPPGVTPPDYVATVIEKGAYTKERNLTIMHHGDWSRASLIPEQNGYAEYLATNGTVQIIASATSIGFSRPSRYDDIMDYEPHNTGERQTYLDETCTVWEIERPKSGRTGSPTTVRLNGLATTRLSCVTDDGIELWQKRDYQTSTSSQKATHIERRPVSAEDSVPSPRLALDWWDMNAPASAASEIPDHEVVMKLPDLHPLAASSVRTRRRSGQWTRLDETLGARRRLRIIQELSQFSLSFWTDETGRTTSLYVMRRNKPADPSELAKAQSQPKALDRKEAVLGENCDWFDLAPGLQDGSMTACLAQDRVALAEENSWRPSHPTVWTAVSVSRRTITPDEMKPPAELFDPQTWLR